MNCTADLFFPDADSNGNGNVPIVPDGCGGVITFNETAHTEFRNGSRALLLDGKSCVESGKPDDLFHVSTATEPYSFAIWFKAHTNKVSFFVLKDHNYGVRWHGATNALQYYEKSGAAYARGVHAAFALNAWYHVTVLNAGKGRDMLKFIDGVADDESVLSTRFAKGPSLRTPLKFGCYGSQFFDGAVYGRYSRATKSTC